MRTRRGRRRGDEQGFVPADDQTVGGGRQTRVALFVKARFGRSGMTLNASIQQNVASIFGSSWPYPAVPRAGFQEGQSDPTATELTQFQLWVARTLLSKAGVSEDS